jgi:hypothetical protein
MLLLPILLASNLVSAEAKQSPLDIGNCEFGEVAAFSTADCRFSLINTSGRSLTISIEPTAEGDRVKPARLTIPVEGTADVSAHITLGNAVGEVKHHYRVTIDGVTGQGFARASGFALGSLDQLKPNLAFGEVGLSTDAPEKEIELSSRDIPDFRILRIIESPKAVDASIAPDGRTLKVRIRPDAPWAVLDDDIKLAINTPRQKEAWVHVSGDLHGPVSAEKNPVSFGFVAPGKNREVRFDIRHSDGKDFRVGSMELNGINGHGTVSDCEPAKAGCRTIVLHLDDDQKPGIVRGVLAVELPDYDRDLALNVWGILQSPPAPGSDADNESSKPKPKPETKAHDTDTVGTKAEEPVPADADVAKSDPSSVAADASSKSAPERASPAQTPQERDKAYSRAINPPTPPPGTGPLLKWSTATEDSVHGYQIFRSDSADGPFVLQNAKTLLVHPDTGSIYQWRDPNAESGKAYWYYIGVVYKNGKKENLSSPQRTVAK